MRNQITTEITDFFEFYQNHLSFVSPANKAIKNYLANGISRDSLPTNHKIGLMSLYRAADEFLTQKDHYLILQLGEITELSQKIETMSASQHSSKPIEFVRGAITLYVLLSSIATILAKYETEDAQKR